jgi:hypothetical protein
MWRKGRASEKEALEMILLYLSIHDPDRRRELLSLAERYANESSPPIVEDNDNE